jgi:hypothetical protein
MTQFYQTHAKAKKTNRSLTVLEAICYQQLQHRSIATFNVWGNIKIIF